MTSIALILSIVLLSATAGLAQIPADRAGGKEIVGSSPGGPDAPAQDQGKLHILVVPAYVWFSGLSGNVGAKGITIPVDVGFSDIFDNTNIGYMGAADIRYGKLGLLTDVVYIKLTTQEQSTPFGLLYSRARTRSKTFFVEPDVYGRLFENKGFSVDALAGVRVWRLDNGIDLRAGLLPALSVDSTNVWGDPLLGARLRANLPRGFFATFKGDAGVGPNETWQIFTGAGKEFREKYSFMLAYRRLDVHQRDGGFLYDTSMNGVLLGLAIRFK